MAPLIEPGTNPMVFVTFACTGGNPNASNVGKVINDPDPTIVLMLPAANPAAATAAIWSGVIRSSLEDGDGLGLDQEFGLSEGLDPDQRAGRGMVSERLAAGRRQLGEPGRVEAHDEPRDLRHVGDRGTRRLQGGPNVGEGL